MKSLRYVLAGTAAALLISLGVASPASADDHHHKKVRIIGQVSEINPIASALTVKNDAGVTRVSVTPSTDIELESTLGPFSYDRDIPLTEIKVGDWVKVKARPNDQNGLVVDDIDVRR